MAAAPADIKPENILTSAAAGGQQPGNRTWLVDFGNAMLARCAVQTSNPGTPAAAAHPPLTAAPCLRFWTTQECTAVQRRLRGAEPVLPGAGGAARPPVRPPRSECRLSRAFHRLSLAFDRLSTEGTGGSSCSTQRVQTIRSINGPDHLLHTASVDYPQHQWP